MKTCLTILLIIAIVIVVSTESSPAGVKGNGKKVFGYLTFDDTKWTSSSYGDVPVDSLPWAALTHVTLFASDGRIPMPSSYLNQLPSMTARAHRDGVFAGFCYGGSGDGALITMLNTPGQWPAWINYNLGLIDQYGLDFIEFDLENSVTLANVQGMFRVFYDSLQTRHSKNDPSVHPFIVLTVGASRAASWVSLEPFVGFTNLMSYDYIGDWWGRIIHDFSPKSYKNWNGTGTNLDYYAPIGSTNAAAPSMQQAAIRVRGAGWPLDKIVVGFDINPTYWYGGSFSDGRGPTYIRKPTNGTTQTKSSDLDFSTQWPTLSAIPRDSVHFDQIAQTYWAHTGTSASDDKVWVMGALPGRDSAVWATRQVVDSMNLGGVMFWNLGSEVWSTSSVPPGGRGWFFSQINKVFGGATTPPPPPPTDVTPPSIDLTAPANGATVSGTVTLSATASDNVGVTSVQFSVNGTALGAAVLSAPWTKTWSTSGLANGSYVLRAVASDAAGLKATDSAVVSINAPPPPADLTPPVIDLTAPVNGATVSGTVILTAQASDNVGVTSVQFTINGTALGSAVTAAPWTKNWTTTGLAPGSYKLRATASDAAGLKSSDSATVLIAAPPPPDVTPPTVDLTAPANGTTVSGTVSLTATASDNVGVTSVQFSVNGTALGSAVTIAPWTKSWATTGLAPGSYKILATASDAAGLKASDSATVLIAAPPPPPPGDSIPPAVSVSAPAAGDTVSWTVPVVVIASDASGIASVRLIIDGVATSDVRTSAPYGFDWNSATVTDGPHSISAEAIDAAGLKSTSALVWIYVKNALPPIPPDTGVVGVYADAIVSPWMNASWGSTNTFSSPEQVFEGTYALKTQQNAWGAVSVHSGTWNTPVPVNTGLYDSLRFAVYPETTGLALGIYLENDVAGSFNTVTRTDLPAKRWSVVSIPVGELNPSNQAVHRLNIQNYTSQPRVYHLDRIEFTGASGGPGVVLGIPALTAPPSGAIDIPAQATLAWGSVAGAVTYHVQVALDPQFNGLVVDQPAVAGTSLEAGPLGNQITYYWRVRAGAPGSEGLFSEPYSFTTAVSLAGLKYDRLFVDFGRVPVGTEKTDSVTIRNDADNQRRIVGISTGSSVYTAAPAGFVIPARGSQKLFIKYKPTKKSSDRSRVISVIDLANRVDTISVIGSGVSAPRQRNRGTIVIGDIPPEEVGTDQLFVGNEGDLPLVISSVTSTTDGITVTPSSATIAPYDSVPFQVSVDTKGKGRGMGKGHNQIDGLLIFSNNGFSPTETVRVQATIAGDAGGPVPGSYSLAQNYPNPFNPSTTIEFGLPVESRVVLTIYNVIGQAVRKFAEDSRPAGTAVVVWDGLNEAGEALPSGIYFYRISAEAVDAPGTAFIETKRMMLIK